MTIFTKMHAETFAIKLKPGFRIIVSDVESSLSHNFLSNDMED